MAIPNDALIRGHMEKLVPEVDLETMTTKQFINKLGVSMGGVDLSKKKKFIKATLMEILDSLNNQDDEEEEESESSSEEEESSDEEPEPPKKKARRSTGGGLSAVKEISDDLSKFLGKGKQMARTEVVKSLWDYIKEHDLQNPKDKREILLDKRMRKVFGTDKFTMFTMNKYVGAHIHPFTPVDLTKNTTTPKKTTPRGKKGQAGKKKQGTQTPWRLSKTLSKVVGKDILPRPQVTQALWVYIKEHGLQNPDDRREILCDDALKAVMGGKSKVTMFSMNKYVTPHMIAKCDKSEYV
eukprot:CAMPEP_0197435678 /NCGR_PEP_ID=MMETSP1175-20131217/3243_1 /TAXON_ID=1003142 /ORGANISM="Triceratium dubium, Strain CCMP147" /LENGTH=295 /DNA_ID=CAMNT_0042964777 /DNA_START=232 /DNA_END=1116 /DNA_ORIENTATION=+